MKDLLVDFIRKNDKKLKSYSFIIDLSRPVNPSLLFII